MLDHLDDVAATVQLDESQYRLIIVAFGADGPLRDLNRGGTITLVALKHRVH